MKKKASLPKVGKAEFETLLATMEQETATLRRGIGRVREILSEVDLTGDQATSLSVPCHVDAPGHRMSLADLSTYCVVMSANDIPIYP